MRKAVKEQILQLFETLEEAHKELHHFWQKKEYGKVNAILADCQECAILIGNTIEQFQKEEELISGLEKYCEQLYLINTTLENEKSDGNRLNSSNEIRKTLDSMIRHMRHEAEKNLKVTLKVVFFPYKASMWTSLESIWKAAQADENCEAKVVVIPYYTLNAAGGKATINYEASLFPKDVPIEHYNRYHVEQERPDMIFIHNPYDEYNNVTRVPEKYYSYNLKPYTEQLIYSPYGMMGYYSPQAGSFMCGTSAVQTADRILVQSARVKQIYMDHHIQPQKLVSIGSPKVDAIVNSLKLPVVYPEGWKEKLAGKKVFLINTHLSYFVKGFLYEAGAEGRTDYAKWYHEQLMEQLLNREGCALIWRPHPLLKTMLRSRNMMSSVEFVEAMEARIRESENGVVDENGAYDISFRISDALVTTYSSIIPEYMISGKPVYVFQYRLNEENCKRSPVDYSNLYYMAVAGEERKFPGFVQMVLEGKDRLRENRMEDVHRAFSNLEGTIGQQIYEYLKNQ